jgi:peptide/nickel transport system permease protein
MPERDTGAPAAAGAVGTSPAAPPARAALRAERREGLAAKARILLGTTTRTALSALGAFVAALAIAGAPLLAKSPEHFLAAWLPEGAVRPHTVERVLGEARDFVLGLADGSSFRYRKGYTEWNFLEVGGRFLFVSFAYTALPGAVGLGLGAMAGVASRRRGKGLFDRLADLAAATPDFLLVLLLQGAAIWLSTNTAIKIPMGSVVDIWAPGPFIVMAAAPFALSFRAAATEARRAAVADHVTYARSKGLDERTLLRRHVGAAVFPRLVAVLPEAVAAMQGSLFVVEYLHGLPGMARLLFTTAFAGPRDFYLRADYQYSLVVLALLGAMASCSLSWLFLRAGLGLARKALVRE